MALLGKIKSAYQGATKKLQQVGASIRSNVSSALSKTGSQPGAAAAATPVSAGRTGPVGTSSNAPNATSVVTKKPVYVDKSGKQYATSPTTWPSTVPGSRSVSSGSAGRASTPSLLTGSFGTPSTINSSLTSRSSGGSLTAALPSGSSTGGFTGTVGALGGALATKDNINKDLYGDQTDQTGVDMRQDQGMTNVQALMKQLGLDKAPQTVREDKEYQRAMREQQEAARVVDDYTAQLKTIEAKAQADQLSLEGQGRGIPEAIIGGQQAKIQREAAIKALPVAALLEAAQGRYEAAQSHVDTMFKIISDEIDNDRQYRKDVFNAVVPFMTAQEKRRLDLIDREDDRKDEARKELSKVQQDLVSKIVSQAPVGVRQTLFNAVMSAQDPVEAIQAAGVYGQTIKETSSSSGVALAPEDKRILVGAGFNAEDIKRIQNDVDQFGIDSVLNGLPKNQQDAIRKVYSVEDAGGTPDKAEIEKDMRALFTTAELHEIAKDLGHASMWTNKDADISRMFSTATPEQLVRKMAEYVK